MQNIEAEDLTSQTVETSDLGVVNLLFINPLKPNQTTIELSIERLKALEKTNQKPSVLCNQIDMVKDINQLIITNQCSITADKNLIQYFIGQKLEQGVDFSNLYQNGSIPLESKSLDVVFPEADTNLISDCQQYFQTLKSLSTVSTNPLETNENDPVR